MPEAFGTWHGEGAEGPLVALGSKGANLLVDSITENPNLATLK
jgi:hypothetical protein